jgi:hypothetical protein
MKQTTFIALLLTFVMVIMVLVAAVVFLVQRNRNVAGETLAQEAEEATTAAQSEQLNTDIAVRQAALESAEATRSALESQVTGDQQQIQDLEQDLEENEAALQQAGEELEELAVQLFIFSPKESAIVPPLEPLVLFIAARADAGVESIVISINERKLSQFPAEGQPTYTVRTEWTPPDEGQYSISAVALDREGNASPLESVTIQAAFSSPDARTAALIRRTEADLRSLRFPGGIEPFVEAETAASKSKRLHEQLPMLSVDQQMNIDPLTRQALNLQPASLEIGQQPGDNFLTYYDPDSQELILYEPGSEPEAFGRWVHVHDFAHQMTADAYGLDALDFSALDGDMQAALSALIEGDATYLQYLYTQGEYLSEADKVAISDSLAAAAAGTQDDPGDELVFTYRDGLQFIQALYEEGGYPAVDQAWANLPQSSEQILHPDRYLAGDAPLAVNLPLLTSELEGAWQLIGEDVLGEHLLRQHLLAGGLSAQQVDQAATGWGGGRYAHYRSDDNNDILVMRLDWDTPADENEFSAAYADYLGQSYDGGGTALPGGNHCWQGDDATCLYTQDGETLIIRAPDLGTVAEVLAAL